MTTAEPFDLTGLDRDTARVVALVLRIASGDFTARGDVNGSGDAIDAIVVALNMLAESFQLENAARTRAETLLDDAVRSYDLAPDGFCSCEVDEHVIVKCNGALARMLGVSPEALLERPVEELVQPSARPGLLRALEVLLATGRMPELELSLERADTPVVASVTGSLAQGAPGSRPRFLLAFRDVTATRQLETQLVHSQRMQALGRLAGGVAHDFNNLLFIILASAEQLKSSLVDRPRETGHVEVISDAAERAATLTKDLLAFARHDTGQPASQVVIDEVVDKTRGLLSPLLGPGLELQVDLAAPGAASIVDPSRLGQVLVNLVANARDACSPGGTIRLGTRVRSLSEERPAELPDVPRGTYVELTVADNGAGMGAEVRERIFEPFFTTKAVGQGTGLGLSTVYGIVRRAGGHIGVSSEPGHGSTFSVLLPLTGQPRAARPKEAPAAQAPALLVIEDDSQVRNITVRILRDAGFAVSEADSGTAAIAIAKLGSLQPALIVSDVAMPGPDGVETLAVLRGTWPDVPCLFVTAFAPDHSRTQRLGRVAVLEKPFAPSTLLAQVRDLLAQVGRRA